MIHSFSLYYLFIIRSFTIFCNSLSKRIAFCYNKEQILLYFINFLLEGWIAVSNCLQVSLNPMRITLLSAFGGVRGRYAEGRKDVYFIRFTGCPAGTDPIPRLLKDASDMALRACASGSGYFCAKQLDKAITPSALPLYQSCYDALSGGKAPSNRPFSFGEQLLNDTYDTAFRYVLDLYGASTSGISSTMRKNFGIKLLHWSSQILPILFPSGSLAGGTPKFLWLGCPHESEYLFLVFLTRLGCDVAIFHPAGELLLPQNLLNLSSCVPGEAHPHVQFPDACLTLLKGQETPVSPVSPPANRTPVKKQPVSPTHPPVAASHPSPSPRIPSKPISAATSSPVQPPAVGSSGAQMAPLSYEQLAQLAPSVVMIEVLDSYGECHKTGSGVLIGEGNLVLTNFHVVQGGQSYRIQMENKEDSYHTDQLLKYHSLYDLALLRFPCTGRPIPLYRGPSLARGQNVVAIGSPLGLFNSVSDGIIAGFRQFEEVSMIQFTAPTSPGSSGGALLNQYGRLIGIITAGFREGQNLNLAVDYQTIWQFARGFLPQTKG